MKIVQIIPDLSLGGAEVMCEQLSRQLCAMGNDVTVISLYTHHTPITDRLEQAGIPVLFLDKKSGLDLSVISRLRRTLDSLSPDAVHTHLHALKYTLAASRGRRRTMVHTVHNMAQKEFTRVDRMIAGRAYRRGRVCPAALSPQIRQTVCDVYGLSAQNVPVLYNGIDLSRCPVKTDYTAHTPFRILHIGRFSAQKNHMGLLEAFRMFHACHTDSELYLVGDGDGRPAIEAYLAEHGLEDAVHLTGQQANVYPYLADADMFTLPSLYEGIPMTLIEAMGSALPIVATAVGGVPDMLTEGEEALLTPVDAEAIAEAYGTLYEDAQMRRRLGEGAYKRAERFSALTMAQGYFALYACR